MLFLTWLLQLALMGLYVSAFHPFFPKYRCIEEGKCPATVSERDANGKGIGGAAQEFPAFKIKQRMPTVSKIPELLLTYA